LFLSDDDMTDALEVDGWLAATVVTGTDGIVVGIGLKLATSELLFVLGTPVDVLA